MSPLSGAKSLEPPCPMAPVLLERWRKLQAPCASSEQPEIRDSHVAEDGHGCRWVKQWTINSYGLTNNSWKTSWLNLAEAGWCWKAILQVIVQMPWSYPHLLVLWLIFHQWAPNPGVPGCRSSMASPPRLLPGPHGYRTKPKTSTWRRRRERSHKDSMVKTADFSMGFSPWIFHGKLWFNSG